MKRKRARGGGRKSRSGPTSSLTFRIPDDLRRELELEATEGASVSERLMYHLRRSLNRKREEERDPALQGLLLLIARLAESITGGELMPDKDVRSAYQREWRTDLFQFRAFKFAVKKLLDTLEEPPESPSLFTEEERERMERESAEKFGYGPELTKLFSDIKKSPEAMGAWVFGNVWTRFTKSDLPFTEAERRMIRKQPILGRAMEREYHDFQKSRKALELKPERPRIDEELKRIINDRKLGESETLPPDIEEALKLISKATGTPPTIEEALKLLKLEKPKDESQ